MDVSELDTVYSITWFQDFVYISFGLEFASIVGWSVPGISFLSHLGAVLSRFVAGVGSGVAGLSCAADTGCYAVLSRNLVDTVCGSGGWWL